MMKRTRGHLALWAVLAIVVAACTGGGATTTTDAAPAPTAAPATAAPATTAAPAVCQARIGVMVPVTGPAASIGEEQRNWAQLAVDRYNEEHGTQFEMVEGDTQLDPAQASTVAQQFAADDSIVAVVGPAGSQEVEAVGPIFTNAEMAFVSMSATRESLTDGALPTFFRVVPHDGEQGPTDAQFMIDELGAQKVMIIDDQTSYSTGLADSTAATLEAAGVEVVRESVSQDVTDFSALVAKIDADVVFLPWQIAANAQLFGEQMAEQGKEAVIFGSDGLFSPSDFTIEGAYVSAFAPDIRGIAADADLVAAYESQYGDFGTFGPPTYAAVVVVLDAIKSLCDSGADITRAAVVEAVRAVNQSESILGQPITFAASGDVEGARFFIFQIKDGSYELVK
jgi:branched-chain amino acid transport system substrate-binding protein